MADKLLCPFCQQELDWLPEDIYGNRWCKNCSKLYGSEELWQALIDTKKKLDIAVDALKVYSSESGNWWYGYEFQGFYDNAASETADKALEQINKIKGGINESL